MLPGQETLYTTGFFTRGFWSGMATIPGCSATPAMWNIKDLGVTQAGGLASAWGNQSGEGTLFQQSTGGYQPQVAAGQGLSFDGIDNTMYAAAANNYGSVSALEWYVVFTPGVITSDEAGDLRQRNAPVIAETGGLFTVNLRLGGTVILQNYAGARTYAELTAANGWVQGSAGLFSARHDSGNIVLTNLKTKASATTSSGNTTNLNGLLRIGGYSSYFANITVAEVICFGAVLSAADRAVVEAYLRGKYLPSSGSRASLSLGLALSV